MNVSLNQQKKMVKNIVFTIVSSKSPTHENLRALLFEAIGDMAKHFPGAGLNTPVEQSAYADDLVEEYESSYGVVVRPGRVLGGERYKPWLKAALDNGKIEFKSFQNYKDERLAPSLNEESIKNIDEITSLMLDYLGDPSSYSGYQTFGLLLGDVQSGKTATYTALCHKAADAGYRFILVLTGTKSSLRSQTQTRLNSDLMSIEEDANGNKTHSDLTRVFDWNRLTNAFSDFTSTALLDKTISPDNQDEVTVAVTQKNSVILSNILQWLTENVKALHVADLPALIIDDEADAASINTRKPGEDPTTINHLIRQILLQFRKSAYLAVTATPFANVFIDPQIDPETHRIRPDSKELPDLFPRDFIYALPPPDGYLGVERLFGALGDLEEQSFKYRCVIPIYDKEAEDEELSGEPTKYKKEDKVDHLPETLQKAVLYFLLACTYRSMVHKTSENLSMLVHLARYKNIQNQLLNLIQDLLERVIEFAEVEGGRQRPETLANPIYQQLKTIWTEGCGDELWYEDSSSSEAPLCFGELTGKKWEDVWKRRFLKVLKTIQVVSVNTDSKLKDLKSIYENNDGHVIVVGGDALSRGLTLEGLCVSYFSRRSFAYDTLLQMGRWFGYRDKFKNCMRVWISPSLIDAYGYISEAVSEFRTTVKTMGTQGSTPEEFGLKIRRSPKTVRLMVTAANKRRTAKKYRMLVDMAGSPVQASTLPSSATARRRNIEIVSQFLRSLGPSLGGDDIEPDSQGKRDLVWTGVSAGAVADLLRNFRVPSWGSDITDITPMANKIQLDDKEWSVRVINVNPKDGDYEEDVFNLGPDRKVVCSRRTMYDFGAWYQPAQRAVLSPSHFARHWSREKIKAVLEENNQKGEQEEPIKNIYPGDVLCRSDEFPQLLIYPLRAKNLTEETKEKKNKKEIGRFKFVSDEESMVTLVFGVPGKKNEVYLEYDTNKIHQMQQQASCYYDEGDEE